MYVTIELFININNDVTQIIKAATITFNEKRANRCYNAVK